MAKKEDVQRVSIKDDDPVRQLCVRFKKDYQQTRDFKDAVAYLSLRGKGCPRKEALLFAAKNNCRVDTTKGFDGPKDFRTLKIQAVPPYMVSEGWLYGQLDYNLGSCFPSRYSDNVLDHQNINKLEENFDDQEIKMRKEYKEMISRMKDYVKQINQKYNFCHEKGQKLLDMVKKIVKGMKTELENRQYFVMNGVCFYEAADAIMKKKMLSDDEKNNLIEKLNVFQNFENEEDLQQVQIFKINDEDQNGEDSPFKNPFFVGMFNNAVRSRGSIVTTKNSQAQSRKSQLGFNNVNTSSISYAHQLKNLEHATKLLEEFEKGEGEELTQGPQGKFDRSYADQKKLRQEQMKNNLNLVREENQIGLEGQFNQQKYFFNNEEKKDNNLRREQQEKEDLQNLISDIYKKNDDEEYYKYKSYINNSSAVKHMSQQQIENNLGTSQVKRRMSAYSDGGAIDMEIIKSMKVKQQQFQENFRNKISTATAPHRTGKFYISTPQITGKRNGSQGLNNSNRQVKQSSNNINNHHIMRSFHYSNNQTTPQETFNLLSQYQSLTNLSSLKYNISNQNYNNTSSSGAVGKYTPIQSSNHLNSYPYSQFNTSNSLHKTPYTSALNIKGQNNYFQDNKQLKKQLLNEEKPNKNDRSIRQINKTNNDIGPSNRSMRMMMKNQPQSCMTSSQNLIDSDKNIFQKSFNSQNKNVKSRQCTPIDQVQRNSPVTSITQQSSPANQNIIKKQLNEKTQVISLRNKNNLEKQGSGRIKQVIFDSVKIGQSTPMNRGYLENTPQSTKNQKQLTFQLNEQ